MKHKWLVLSLISISLLTSCGANPTAEARPVTENSSAIDDAPMIFPLTVGEAPISTLTAPQYPDALRVDITLHDTTEDVKYGLEDFYPDDFRVCSGHDYSLTLQLHSDGDDIKDIQVQVKLPGDPANPYGNCLCIEASNRETTQILMLARVFMAADNSILNVQPIDETDEIFYSGMFLGDIGNIPTDVIFEFHAF